MAAAPKIQTLPPPLKEEKMHQNDYFPKVVSIGPYFHGKPELALVQRFKETAVELLISAEYRNFYHGKILEIIDEIRNCYEEESLASFSNDGELAEMMLLDASLIILYMEITAQPPLDPLTLQHKFSKMKEHLGLLTVAIFPRDLFLLQNQIPLRVINLLMNLVYTSGQDKILLDRFLNTTFSGREKTSSPEKIIRPEPLHLLEASHRLIVSDHIHPIIPNGIHDSIETKKLFHSFRTVTDLKAKGIRFKPSPTESLKDVNFKSYFFYARIHLPWWAVSTYTKVFLKNMVAYELGPNSPADGEVTSYINLMKSLIDRAEDVKELRERRILCNMLSSDEEAAAVYNDIDTYGADNPKLFGQVKEQIHAHCNRRVNTWMAELLHSYFRSPWTITAFFAAAALLVISSAQLYYAVYPPPN